MPVSMPISKSNAVDVSTNIKNIKIRIEFEKIIKEMNILTKKFWIYEYFNDSIVDAKA